MLMKKKEFIKVILNEKSETLIVLVLIVVVKISIYLL